MMSMRRHACRLAVCVIAGALADCANVGPPVTESDDGRTIDIALGQRVDIRLLSHRTTGYRWMPAVPLSGVLASLGEAAYTSDAAAAGVAGAGGIETWSYRASRRGTEALRFEYRRPWEGEATAARVVRYTIRVR